MTDSELNSIVTQVVNKFTTNAVDLASVDIINDATTLANKNVNTLPGSTSDGTIVQVAIDVLAKPAREAASSANSAASSANAAASSANTAKEDITTQFNTLQTNAQSVVDACTEATTKALQASNNIGNKKILVVTEDEYSALSTGESITIDDVTYTIDDNTIYFVTES